jgi:hypothetical protein
MATIYKHARRAATSKGLKHKYTAGCCGLDEIEGLYFGSVEDATEIIRQKLEQRHYDIATFATTVPHQHCGIAGLKANKFVPVTEFFNPGHGSTVTLWLRRASDDKRFGK